MCVSTHSPANNKDPVLKCVKLEHQHRTLIVPLFSVTAHPCTASCYTEEKENEMGRLSVTPRADRVTYENLNAVILTSAVV